MIVFSSTFRKDFKRLYKRYMSLRKDLEDVLSIIEKDPCYGIDLGCGVRKIRMAIASKNKGKSGGARIISYNYQLEDNGDIILLTMYDKSERASITDREIQRLIELCAEDYNKSL